MLICGIDEVGRGCLAGPIIAVAAVFECTPNEACPIDGVKDSKAFPRSTALRSRRIVYSRILGSLSFRGFGVGQVEAADIDADGIDAANQLAFIRALAHLSVEPDSLIVDGVHAVASFPKERQLVVPKADAIHWQVGAASILAKVTRDEMMIELDLLFPAYFWRKNVGYGTPQHCNAIRIHGPCVHHRRTFLKSVTAGA